MLFVPAAERRDLLRQAPARGCHLQAETKGVWRVFDSHGGQGGSATAPLQNAAAAAGCRGGRAPGPAAEGPADEGRTLTAAVVVVFDEEEAPPGMLSSALETEEEVRGAFLVGLDAPLEELVPADEVAGDHGFEFR